MNLNRKIRLVSLTLATCLGGAHFSFGGDVNMITLPPYTTGAIHKTETVSSDECKLLSQKQSDTYQKILKSPANVKDLKKALEALIARYNATCILQDAAAIREGYQRLNRTMRMDFKPKGIDINIGQFPKAAWINEEASQVIQLGKTESTTLGKMLSDIDVGMDAIQSFYLKVKVVPIDFEEILSKAKSVTDLEALPDVEAIQVVNEIDRKNVGSGSGVGGNFELLAIEVVHEQMKYMIQQVLSNEDGEMPFNVGVRGTEIQWLETDLLFAHYFDIERISKGTKAINLHIFLIDLSTTIKTNTPGEFRHPIYERSTGFRPWKGNGMTYVATLNPEVSYILGVFSKSR